MHNIEPELARRLRRTGYLLTGILALLIALLSLSRFVAHASTESQSAAARPNFLIIISDDQRYDTMEYMPRTTSLIFDQGVTFKSAYTTTSRCCPSRASILTGLYVHNHGVYVNDGDLEKTTFVRMLHEAGYYTGVIGKYLNSYPDDVADPPLPEFDEWYVFKEGIRQSRYFDTVMNINGAVEQLEGYQTYLLRDFALDFIQQASDQDQPFLLMFDPFAPHLPALPAPGDEALYTDLPPYRPPNFNEEDMSDKPQWLADLRSLRPRQIEQIEADRLTQIQSLNALDVSVESIIHELEQQGVLENTVVVYLSDNGFFWGEHRLETGKIFVYEPSTHVPFAIRYPSLIPEPYVEHAIVANIDLAPTIYDLAGVEPPYALDGRSLIPLIEGDDWDRSHILIEGWPVRLEEIQAGKLFQAIHTGRYVYVETENDRSELYDLEIDPFQLDNQIDNPDYAHVIVELRAALAEERKTIPPVSMEALETKDTDDFEPLVPTDESTTSEPEATEQSAPSSVKSRSNVLSAAIAGLAVAALIGVVFYFRKVRSS